jgi:hypothetical protein
VELALAAWRTEKVPGWQGRQTLEAVARGGPIE